MTSTITKKNNSESSTLLAARAKHGLQHTSQRIRIIEQEKMRRCTYSSSRLGARFDLIAAGYIQFTFVVPFLAQIFFLTSITANMPPLAGRASF